jgi:hypothetical protein
MGATMTNEIWERRREQLEEEARQALLKLFEHMGSPASAQLQLDKQLWARVEIMPDPATA